MIHFTRFSLLLGMAASLAAQTLSFGEITLLTPATSNAAAVYNVNLVLSTANTAYSGLVAGLQFDLQYDPTSLKVTIGQGAQTANQQIDTVCLTNFTGCSTYAANNPSTKVAQDTAAGQRAIIIGCCSSNQVNNSAQYPVTSNLISDGAVAVLTVQATATPNNLTLTLPAAYLAATSAGGQNTAAQAIPLSVGQGSNDPNGTGKLSLSSVYLVGGVYPSTSDTAPNFGSGTITLNDLILELFAVNNIAGYTPACDSNRFDAMDTFPVDTATTRGGLQNGTLTLNDLIVELFRLNKLQGYTAWPVRIPATFTYVCAAGVNPAAAGPTSQARVRPPVELRGTLVIGTAEAAAAGQERVPVYLEAGRSLARVGVTFGLGDQQSQLRFQAAPGLAPSLMQDSQPGIVAAAWIQGLDVNAGQRLLLGYVVGPAGFAANLRVFGASASGIDDFREVGLDVSGATVVRQ